MKSHAPHSTGFGLFKQRVSNISTECDLLERFFYHLKIHILPTFFFLIFSIMISLYISEVIYRAKKHSTVLKLAQNNNSHLSLEFAGKTH